MDASASALPPDGGVQPDAAVVSEAAVDDGIPDAASRQLKAKPVRQSNSLEAIVQRKSGMCSNCFERNRPHAKCVAADGKTLPCEFCVRRKMASECRPVTIGDVRRQRSKKREYNKQWHRERRHLPPEEKRWIRHPKPDADVTAPDAIVGGTRKRRTGRYRTHLAISPEEEKVLVVRADRYRQPCKRCCKERNQAAGTSDCIGTPCIWCTENNVTCERKVLNTKMQRKWVVALAQFPADAKFLPFAKRCSECNFTRGPEAVFCEVRPPDTACQRCTRLGLECKPDVVMPRGERPAPSVEPSARIARSRRQREATKSKRKRLDDLAKATRQDTGTETKSDAEPAAAAANTGPIGPSGASGGATSTTKKRKRLDEMDLAARSKAEHGSNVSVDDEGVADMSTGGDDDDDDSDWKPSPPPAKRRRLRKE